MVLQDVYSQLLMPAAKPRLMSLHQLIRLLHQLWYPERFTMTHIGQLSLPALSMYSSRIHPRILLGWRRRETPRQSPSMV